MITAAGTRGKVLVVEDDPGIRRLQRSTLERAGYRVELAADPAEAREALRPGDVDLLVLDYQLGVAGESGLDFYRGLLAEGHTLPAILVTGFTDEARLLEAMRAGVRDFIPKTPNFVELVAPTVERVMREVRAERRLQEAEAAGRAKDNLLAALSHELRTPLTPVLARVSALGGDERLPADVREDLEMIRRNIELEARLIDDMLDLTRVARGKLELRPEPTDLRPIAEHAFRTCCVAVEEARERDCRLELAPGPHPVRADAGRLTQVFWNLLNNAVKFTPPGGCVRLRSRREKPAGDGAPEWLAVEVSDTGIGVDPALLPRIFDAFEQGDRGITRQFGGLGLGLAICRAIVEHHGGQIAAESDGEGKGTTFTVRLPVCEEAALPGPERGAPAPPAAAATLAEPAPHLLLVEDHGDTAQVMARMLRRSRHEVSVAGSVAQALAIAEEAVRPASGALPRPVQLVVSDLGLPDGTGLDLMRRLRARYGLRGIALSGYGQEEDIRHAREAGFERHMTKPIDFPRLLAAIGELLEPVDRQ